MRLVGDARFGQPQGGRGSHPVPTPTGAPSGVRPPEQTVARLALAGAVSERPPTPAPEGGHQPGERELLAKRDRLIERFAAMQLDLGGVYYEMAIRDHVNEPVLIGKAAEMQRVDAELRHVEAVLAGAGTQAVACEACGAHAAPGASFCSRCGRPLAAGASQAGP
jgi:hypothetical protein